MTSTYHEMPQEMYPVHIAYPDFDTKGLWFPALDAWILELLCRKLRSKISYCSLRIMEIGSFVGGSASILSRHASYLLCVDTWQGSGKPNDEMAPLYQSGEVLKTFQSNTAQFPIRPHIHVRTTDPDSLPEHLELFEHPFDLIFIDGGHDYDSVKNDIQIARKHIAPGGIICGHDFTMFDGVTKAALDFGEEAGGIEACGTIWWKEMT